MNQTTKTNKYIGGQLGLGNAKGFYETPQSVTAGSVMDTKKIIQVSASRFHTIALQDNGNFFGWGKNSGGQVRNNSVLSLFVHFL